MTTSVPNPAIKPREFLEHLYAAAVKRALPLHNTAAFLPKPPKGRTIVIGAGKAGGSMAQAVEALWPADAPLEEIGVLCVLQLGPCQAIAKGGLWVAHECARPRRRAPRNGSPPAEITLPLDRGPRRVA